MWILDPAFSTKYSEVTYVWLLTSQVLIRGFLQKFVEINTVDDVACSVNGFRPELSWSLVLIKHRLGHLNKSSVLALRDAILLRCVRSKELMSDTHGIQVHVEAGVLEHSAVVASDMLDLDAIVCHGTIGKASEDILHFSLVEDYMHPSISRVIIDNDEAIEASSSIEIRVVSRAK